MSILIEVDFLGEVWLLNIVPILSICKEKGSLSINYTTEEIEMRLDSKNLREYEDFILCQHCGKRLSQISPSHLKSKSCSFGTYEEYIEKYPKAELLSDRTRKRRGRSPALRKKQSETLKARFQTPEGEITRKQISEASKIMQAGEYGAKAAAHLKKLNADPEQRERLRKETTERWKKGGDLRKKGPQWHKDNRELSLKMVQNARRNQTKRFTKPHQAVKEALEERGMKFITEFEVGYYSIDEADPEQMISVEVDGCYFHGCEQCGFPGRPEVRATDNRKTSYLKNRGWTIVRIPAHDVPDNLDSYLDQIEKLKKERSEDQVI